MASPLNLAIYKDHIDGDESLPQAVTLEEASACFSFFAKGLSEKFLKAKAFKDAPSLLANPHRPFPFCNGREIYLPAVADAFDSRTDNWRLLRILTAMQAGQWEMGTFDRPSEEVLAERGIRSEKNDPLSWLARFLGYFSIPILAADIFLILEEVRILASIQRIFPGLSSDAQWLLERLNNPAEPANHRQVLWNLFFTCFGFLPGKGVQKGMLDTAGPLTDRNAVLKDTMRATMNIYRLMEENFGARLSFSGRIGFGDSFPLQGIPKASAKRGDRSSALSAGADEEMRLEPEEMIELDFVSSHIPAGTGGFITDRLLIERIELDSASTVRPDAGRKNRRMPGSKHDEALVYSYPEWDYKATLYRRNWVTVFESQTGQGNLEKAAGLLREWNDLVREVLRQFRMLRFQERTWRKKLEWGQDMDIDQVVNRIIETRYGLAPDDKVYMERRRTNREVSTVFLIDLSASTSAEIELGSYRGETVLSMLMTSISIMARALDQLDDRYAIYGFSGFGRNRVNLLRIKSFNERLNEDVWKCMAGLEPMRSTRMGAAVRHCHHLLESESSPLKLMLLLSDGYPQDFDYGEDRTDREYGLRDTAQALREAEAAKILPFCLTIDAAGNDYLRRILPPHSYMVLKSVADLPSQLPKVYMRLREI
jgi:nitric oxide reductase NorD protein